jgi:hypothetical protein
LTFTEWKVAILLSLYEFEEHWEKGRKDTPSEFPRCMEEYEWENAFIDFTQRER